LKSIVYSVGGAARRTRQRRRKTKGRSQKTNRKLHERRTHRKWRNRSRILTFPPLAFQARVSNVQIQRALKEETERHRSEVDSLESQIERLTSDLKESRRQVADLEAAFAALNEDLRTAKRVEDSLNDEIQGLREKAFSGSRDAEYVRKLQAENAEFNREVASLQQRLDRVSAARDRLAVDVSGQANETARLEREIAPVRAERDEAINQRNLADSQVRTLRSQLEDTKQQVEIQASRLRLTEQNLADAREDLAREQARATNLLASPHTQKHSIEMRKLEDLLQQSRLRCAEMGKINATQLGEIDTLNRKIRRLEGELEVFQQSQTSKHTGAADRALHSQLTLAKGQLAEAKTRLARQQEEFAKRMEEQMKGSRHTADLRAELSRLETQYRESTLAKGKLEDQVRTLTQRIAQMEFGPSADDKSLYSRYQALKAEMDVLREEAEEKESKSFKQLRKLQEDLESVRDHATALERDLARHKTESTLIRRQLQDSRETATRLKSRNVPDSAMAVEKRHGAELRGLGKQIRYLKAKLFREQSFRTDLQYAKNFFLMQINCFES